MKARSTVNIRSRSQRPGKGTLELLTWEVAMLAGNDWVIHTLERTFYLSIRTEWLHGA